MVTNLLSNLLGRGFNDASLLFFFLLLIILFGCDHFADNEGLLFFFLLLVLIFGSGDFFKLDTQE